MSKEYKKKVFKVCVEVEVEYEDICRDHLGIMTQKKFRIATEEFINDIAVRGTTGDIRGCDVNFGGFSTKILNRYVLD